MKNLYKYECNQLILRKTTNNSKKSRCLTRRSNYYLDRISKETGISKDDLNKLIDENTKGKWLGLYGQERVNVLELNLSVDDVKK